MPATVSQCYVGQTGAAVAMGLAVYW